MVCIAIYFSVTLNPLFVLDKTILLPLCRTCIYISLKVSEDLYYVLYTIVFIKTYLLKDTFEYSLVIFFEDNCLPFYSLHKI